MSHKSDSSKYLSKFNMSWGLELGVISLYCIGDPYCKYYPGYLDQNLHLELNSISISKDNKLEIQLNNVISCPK